MEEKEITIESTWWQNESQTDIIHLRDIEFRIIASMYESKKLFENVVDGIPDDSPIDKKYLLRSSKWHNILDFTLDDEE